MAGGHLGLYEDWLSRKEEWQAAQIVIKAKPSERFEKASAPSFDGVLLHRTVGHYCLASLKQAVTLSIDCLLASAIVSQTSSVSNIAQTRPLR